MSDAPLIDISFELPAEVACRYCRETIDVQGIGAFDLVNCPKCTKSFPLPVQFGAFVLLEKIAQGGMGAVFKGFDPALKRPVAIKVMRRQLGTDEAFVQQFQREAQMLARINHPNIVQVYTAGKEQGQPYMVMELVDGGQLSSHAERGKGLDEKFVLTTAIDVIKGLKAAADIGLAHGDLKPANILYDRQGHAKVVDFGLARFHGEKWQDGKIWGTPYFIAPEVVRGKQPSMQSDIYSLGCTLYFALAGVHAFEGATVEEAVAARFRVKPKSVHELNPAISPATAATIDRMLELDLLKRYPNYKSLLDDMTAALAALTSAKSAPAGKSKRPRPWRIGLTVGTAAVFLVVWAIRARNAERAAPPPAKKTIILKTSVKKPPAELEPIMAPKPTATKKAARTMADDAAAYDEWADGATGGEGFDPWVLRCGGNSSGFFVGSSEANAGEGRINTAGKAWGMFASGGEKAEAWRRISDGPLEPRREKLRVDFDHGIIDAGGPTVGLGLQNASSNNLWELFFPGGAAHYVVRDGEGERDSGIPFSSESLLVEFRLTSPTDYTATIIAGMDTFTLKGSLTAQNDPGVRVVHLWNNNAGAGSQFDVYFNNLSVGPAR